MEKRRWTTSTEMKDNEGHCLKLIHVNCSFSVLTTNYALSPGVETLS